MNLSDLCLLLSLGLNHSDAFTLFLCLSCPKPVSVEWMWTVKPSNGKSAVVIVIIHYSEVEVEVQENGGNTIQI